MPVVEETRVHLAVTRLLTAISAQDVLRCRSGSRPQVGALEAVDAWTITRPCGRETGVVDADSTGCFATIAQAWRRRMGAERSEDRARRRLSTQWRTAGGRDTDGTVRHPATGRPHGGVVSPLLAHVSVPYGLDRWWEKVVQRHWHGEAGLIRSADESGCAFAPREDAERVDTVLGQRVRTCGRERSGDTTRLLPCRRRPAAAPTRGECLGCAGYGGKDRAGTEHLTRRTARQQ